jgi:PadR family transcriptional regulator, regulatory protein PadR
MESMESQEAGFPPLPHSLEVPAGLPNSHGSDDEIRYLKQRRRPSAKPYRKPPPRRKKGEDFLLLSKRKHGIIPVGNLKVELPMKEKPDVLQGTLALMVLKTLDLLEPQHGYGIARRIEQISGDLLDVNQGTLYPLLLKLEHEGSIASQWGASENNRRARFYRLTAAGRRQLQAETRDWEQTAAIIARFFKVKAEDLA